MFDYISKFTNESIELEHILRLRNKELRLKNVFFYLAYKSKMLLANI